LLIGGLVSLSSVASAADAPTALTGAQEVPAVMTKATGVCKIVIGTDRIISGSVDTSGVEGSMAHIHLGAVGTNGPVVITLVSSGQGTWSVPMGAKLTDAQYASYRHGDLYVNVHSAMHPGGEMRLQLTP
jgi:hypothetical protein